MASCLVVCVDVCVCVHLCVCVRAGMSEFTFEQDSASPEGCCPLQVQMPGGAQALRPLLCSTFACSSLPKDLLARAVVLRHERLRVVLALSCTWSMIACMLHIFLADCLPSQTSKSVQQLIRQQPLSKVALFVCTLARMWPM